MIQKNLAVGFADLDSWLKLNELISTEKAIQSLLIKFREIDKIIENQNGEVRKFIGDSVFFSFENIRDAVSPGKEISTI